MPTFDEIMRGGNTGGSSSGGSGITPERYIELYNQIYNANPTNLPQGAYQDYSEDINVKVPQMRGWHEGDVNAPTRTLGLGGRAALKLSDWGENLQGITGWDPNEGFTLPNIGRFALSLPFQMAGGILETPAMLTEAATGQNILDRDAEGDPYAYNLTDSQRLSQAANAGINVGGLFFGGTGKALGFGAELMGAEKLGGALMNKNVSGFARREVANALGGTKKAKAAGIAAGSAIDAGEEATEEYIQSHLDDERWNTKDNSSNERALNAAAWGALGGGIMGGVSHTGHTVFESATANASNAASPGNTANAAPAQSQSPDFAWLHVNQVANQNGDVLTSDSTKALEDKAKENMDQAASGMVRLVADYNDRYSFYQGGIGVEDIYDQFHSRVAGSAQAIANAFGLSVSDMAKILDQDPIKAAKALQDRLDQMTVKPIFYVQKMPSANETTATKFDLTHVSSRRGVYLHPAWPSMSNADKDGDKVQVFWDPAKFTYTPYAFQQILNPLGQIALDDKYTGLDDDRVLTEALDYLENQNPDIAAALKADPDWTRLKREWQNAKDDKDKFKAYYTMLDKALAIITNEQSLGVERAKQFMDYINERNRRYNVFHTNGLANYTAVFEEELTKISKRAEERIAKGEKPGIHGEKNAGTKGNLTSSFISDMRDLYNLVIWTDSEDANPAFRANVLAIFKATERIVETYGNPDGGSSVFDDLVTAISGLTSIGEKFVDQLSEIRKSLERYMIEAEWAKNNIVKITSSNQEEAIKIAVEILNDTRRKYIESIEKKMTTEKGNPVLEVVKGSIPQEINSDNMSWNSPIFAQRFIETFGDYRAGLLFDNLTDDVKDLTLKQIAARIYVGDASQIGVQLSGASYAQNLFLAAMKAHKHRGDVVVQKLLDVGESFVRFKRDSGDSFQSAINEYLASGANSSYSTVLALSNWIMAFQKLMGIKGAIYASDTHSSIASIGNALNNPFIKALWERDLTAEQVVDLIASFRLSFRYKDIIEHIDDPTYDFDYAYRQLAGTTPLDTLLYEHYKKNKDSDDPFAMLRFFANPEKVVGEKQLEYEEMFNTSGLTDTSSFLNDVFTGGEDSVGMGALNKDIKKAQRDIIEAKKQLGEHVKVESRRIKEALTDSHGAFRSGDFINFMNSMLKRSQSHVDLQVFTNAIWTQQFLTKEGKEKAQVDRANAGYAMSVNQSVNGTMFSVVDAIFVDQGVIDIQSLVNNRPQLLHFLSGDIKTLRLFDPRTGRRGEITLKEFCNYITGDASLYKEGNPLPVEFWIAVCDKCPQLWSAIVPHKTGTIMTEGGLQTRSGMESQDIYSTLLGEFSRYSSSSAEFEVQSRRQAIFDSIVKSPGMMSVIASICSKEIKVSQNDLVKARKAVESVINRFIDYAVGLSFQDAATREDTLGSVFDSYASINAGKLYSDLLQELYTLFNITDSKIDTAITQLGNSVFSHGADILYAYSINSRIAAAKSNPNSPLSNLPEIGISTEGMNQIMGNFSHASADFRLKMKQLFNIIAIVNNLNGTLYSSSRDSSVARYFDIQIQKAKAANDTALVNELEQLRINPFSDIFPSLDTDGDSHLTIDMFFDQDRSRLEKMMRTIISKDPELRSEYDKNLTDVLTLYDPNNSSLTDKRKAAIKKYNQRLLFAQLNDFLRVEDQSHANPWKYGSYMQATDIVKGWLTDTMGKFEANPECYSIIKLSRTWGAHQLENLIGEEALDFSDAATSALFTQSLNSFNGSPISAGIGINGAKTNLFAAFGSLPDDYLQDQVQYRSRSAQREPSSMASSLIKRMINWEQEPLFLQLKKTLAGLQDVARETRIGSKDMMTSPLNIEKTDLLAPDAVDRLKNAVLMRRTKLGEYLKSSIKNGGFQVSDKIKLSDDDYFFLASMVTPFVNLRIGSEVFIVDVQRLFSGSPDWLDGHAQQREILAALNSSAPVSIDLDIVSLDELSYKILRETSGRVQPSVVTQPGYVFDDQLLRSDAKKAALSFEYLNDSDNQLNAADLIAAIPFSKVATGGRSVVGTTTSALQTWQTLTGESMLSPQVSDNISGRERRYRGWEQISVKNLETAIEESGKLKEITDIQNNTTGLSRAIHGVLSAEKTRNIIVSYDGGGMTKSSISGKQHDKNIINALNRLPKPEETGNNGYVNWSPTEKFAAQSGYSLWDIVLSQNARDVQRAFLRASAGGRSMIIRQSMVDQINKARSESSFKITTLGGGDYASVTFEHTSGDPVATDPFSWIPVDKRSIMVTLFTERHIMGDTGVSQAPTAIFSNKNQGRYEVQINKRIPLDKLFGRRNDVISLIDPSDAAAILAELNAWESKPSVTPRHIDMRYWDKVKIGYEDRVLIERMKSYLKTVQSKGVVPTSLTNISQGDCIGFMRVKNGSVYDYAPVFWWGDASSAKSISLCVNRNNDLEINGYAYMSTTKSAIKQYIDGIAYKFFVSQSEGDKWVTISDGRGGKVSPDVVADAKVLPGRVVGQENTSMLRNAWWFTRIKGGNLLLEKDGNGNWIPNRYLSQIAKDNLQFLLSGDPSVWSQVISGKITLFDVNADAPFDIVKFNRFFRDLLTALQNKGCSPIIIHRIICPTQVTAKLIPSPDGNPELAFTEKESNYDTYDSEIDVVLKPFMYDDFDNVLRFWNMITPGTFCSSLDESLKTTDGTNANFFMNALGQVWSNATNEEGEKLGWCYCAIGPHHFLADSDFEGAPSTEAAMGMQPQISMMMDYNVLPDDLKDIMMFLMNHNSISTTDPDGYYRYLETSNAGNRGITAWSTEEFNPYEDVAKRSLDHISDTYKMMEYTTILREEARAIHSRLRIVDSKDLKSSADPNSADYKTMKDALEAFNRLLFGDNVREFLQPDHPVIGSIVRVYHGLLEDGMNVSGATPSQVTAALNSVKQRIESGQTMFEGGMFNTRGADERVCIGLIDYSTAKRLFDKSEKIRAVYQSMDSFLELHSKEQEKALEQLSTLQSRSQEIAIRKMIDATRFTHDGKIPSGFTGEVSIADIIQRDIQLAERGLSRSDPQMIQALKDNLERSREYFENVNLQIGSKNTWADTSATNGGGKRIFAGDTDIAARKVSEHLMSLNAMQRLNLPELFFANVGERGTNLGAQRMLINLSKFNIGPFAGLKSHITRPKGAPDLIREIAHRDDVVSLFAAMRTAEIHGFYQEFMERVRTSPDVEATIKTLMKEQGVLEKFASQLQDIVSGKNIFLPTQIENFLDMFDMHIDSMAPWWGIMETTSDGRQVSRFQRALETSPRDFLLEIFFGTGSQAGPDVMTAQKAYNWSKRGDMAQRNVVSAIFSCIADHNQVVKFLTSTLVTPFFQYQTDRLIKILNWIAPMSSIHYVVTEALSKSDRFVPGTKKQVKFSQLNLDSVQWNMTLREAMMSDMLQLGAGFTALILLSFSGSVEPPDDEDKWCNFKEWTIFGKRIDEAWWIEDVLGLALPMLMWMRSAQLGMPRIDILVNGLTYYLSNNPAVKVADAVAVLFDPFSEFYQEYDEAQDSFAKALGGPPTVEDIAMGRATSFGLGYLAQFITPAFLKEIYNAGIEYQPSWKRVYEENATGGLSKDAIDNGATMMTSYQDAIIRKYTKNNPVMGFLADLMFNSPTGYMAHEMPDVIYYDPYQIDSLRRFSLYEDPETKKIEKSDKEKQAMAMYIVSLLQMYSVDELSAVGFILDSDTKAYVSEFLWDQVAECNRQWYELLESGNLDPYLLGNGDYQAGLRSKQVLQDAYYKRVNEIKSLYYDKLWADELSNLVKYRQKHTRYAQDANGEWYATGYYPGFITPLYLIPGESQTDGWQAVMSRENDWTAESAAIPEMSTNIRGLVPIPSDSTRTPGFETWSSDGTDTGYSNSGIKSNPEARNNKYANYTPSGSSRYSSSSYPRYTSGYSRSSGGGGGGGSNAPDIYYRNNTPNTPSASTIRRTSRAKEDMDYLRPNFETKGSREAYKRGDI